MEHATKIQRPEPKTGYMWRQVLRGWVQVPIPYVVNDGLGRREYFTTRQAAEQYAAERSKFTWATVQTA